jgi:hypothetical protein
VGIEASVTDIAGHRPPGFIQNEPTLASPREVEVMPFGVFSDTKAHVVVPLVRPSISGIRAAPFMLRQDYASDRRTPGHGESG